VVAVVLVLFAVVDPGRGPGLEDEAADITGAGAAADGRRRRQKVDDFPVIHRRYPSAAALVRLNLLEGAGLPPLRTGRCTLSRHVLPSLSGHMGQGYNIGVRLDRSILGLPGAADVELDLFCLGDRLVPGVVQLVGFRDNQLTGDGDAPGFRKSDRRDLAL
jgi:hypothetical protein